MLRILASGLIWLMLFPAGLTHAQVTECLEGTLLEPYRNICAAVNDVRAEFIPDLQLSADSIHLFEQRSVLTSVRPSVRLDLLSLLSACRGAHR